MNKLSLITNMESGKTHVSVTCTLSMPEPSSHFFEVKITYSGVKDKYLDLNLPVWRPGRYYIFDFASGVQQFEASGAGNEKLTWGKIDKCTWRIETGGGDTVNAAYKIYANESQLRTRGLDEEHAFVNGAAVFMYSEKYRSANIELNIIQYKDWHVTTGLESKENEDFVFTAPDYDRLADCPLEIGNQKDFTFDVEGRKHVISFFGDAGYDIEKMKRDFSEIIRKNYEFWGGIPYSRYVFIIHCTSGSGGGTEHINSTVVGVKPDAFLKEDTYKNFLRLISHEFFHTWNVKQLRPKGITPYDYTKENYLEELWIAEGGTSYYDSLILCRTGQLQYEDMFKEIEKAVEEDWKRPGNLIQSLAESSFDAWIKFWKGTQQSFGSETDYYKKGADVSLILDLEIRFSSGNEHSLDDVFRIMYRNYPPGKGYTNNDFIRVCEEFAGGSMKEFFEDYLYGTKPIEWGRYLSYAGIELKEIEKPVHPHSGIVLTNIGGKAIVGNLLPGSSAESAGIEMEDEIIAIEGRRVDFDQVEKVLKDLKGGERVKVTVFRKNELKNVVLSIDESKTPKYRLVKTLNPTGLQESIFEQWLGVKW